MKLSKGEKRMVAIALGNGHVTLNDFSKEWTTPHYARAKAKRLCDIGVFKMTESQKMIPQEERNTLVRWLQA